MLAGLLADADERARAAAVALAPPRSRVALTASFDQLAAAAHSASCAAAAQACLQVVQPLVRHKYRDAAARLADLERLGEAAAAAPDLGSFVAGITLDPPASSTDFAHPPHLDDDYLTLSTVHSAKGLEWPSVHVIRAVDGAFPSDMALTDRAGLDEERRVFYVALTRARDHLHVYTPLRMPHHPRSRDDRHSYAPQSRFLTDEAVAVMDVVLPEPAPAAVGSAARAGQDGGRPRITVPTVEALFR
jgi:DNA helicase-2/ATP-dependent DNA helicase PcrA